MCNCGCWDRRTMSVTAMNACPWFGNDPLYRDYHHREWGAPLYDDRALFELLLLESAQAGLSWLTILRKREGYRRAFSGFRPEKIACYDNKKVMQLLAEPSIVRNRLKIESAIQNARAYLAIVDSGRRFSDYIWQFVDGKPIQNHWQTMAQVPVNTIESQTMSRALKKAGFTFVGPTICYAFMQATGMVNDHLTTCFRHRQCRDLST